MERHGAAQAVSSRLKKMIEQPKLLYDPMPPIAIRASPVHRYSNRAAGRGTQHCRRRLWCARPDAQYHDHPMPPV